MPTPPTFGAVVLCPDCRGLGRRRGSGLDPDELRRRAAIRKRRPDDPAGAVPFDRVCDECGGSGFTAARRADRPQDR